MNDDFTYSYGKTLAAGESQYGPGKPPRRVEAVYRETLMDKGNEFIEALPSTMTDEQRKRFLTKPVFAPTPGELQKMDIGDAVDSVGILGSFRVEMDYHKQLEGAIYRALRDAYRNMKYMEDPDTSVASFSGGKPILTYGRTLTKESSKANAGFTLLGKAGCGKSTSVREILSRCPRMIEHGKGTWHYHIQVPWLTIQCSTTGNFKETLDMIGTDLDKALGNLDNHWGEILSKRHSVGDKCQQIRRLFEMYSVGLLVVDEVERLMEDKKTCRTLLNTILSLNNTTGCAIAVVGTEDAYRNLFMPDPENPEQESRRKTARRLGEYIEADGYCSDRKRFGAIFTTIWKSARWFDGPSDPPATVVDTMFRETKGIIDSVIKLYSAVNIEYLQRRHDGKRVTVDEKFITACRRKYHEWLYTVDPFELADVIMVSETPSEPVGESENASAENRMDGGEDAVKRRKSRMDAVFDICAAVSSSVPRSVGLDRIQKTAGALYDRYPAKSRLEIALLTIDTLKKSRKKKQAAETETESMRDAVLDHVGPARASESEAVFTQ